MQSFSDNHGISTLKVILIAVLFLAVSLYITGALVERGYINNVQETNLSLAILGESVDQRSPNILKDFYLANALKYDLPRETILGWQEMDGDFLNGETLTAFSVISNKKLSKEEKDLARIFLEAKGVTQNFDNSRMSNYSEIEGFHNNNTACLLKSEKSGLNSYRQTLSCAEL